MHVYEKTDGTKVAEAHPTKKSAKEAAAAATGKVAHQTIWPKSVYQQFGIGKQHGIVGEPKGSDEYNRDDHGRFAPK